MLKIIAGRNLRHGDTSNIIFQPVHKFCESYAIFNVGLDQVVDLCIILHRLHKEGGILTVDHPYFFRILLKIL